MKNLIISLLLCIPTSALAIGPYTSAHLRDMLFTWAEEETEWTSDLEKYERKCKGAICTYELKEKEKEDEQTFLDKQDVLD